MAAGRSPGAAEAVSPENALLTGVVGRGGFEPPKAVPADLQSAPFGHSGTDPGEVARIASVYMPSFDVVSELDMQEVRNAVDQAQRELATRFDFKDTGSDIDLGKDELTLRSSSEDRIRAVRQVVEEKFVKRKISLKALDWGKIEEASGSTARQVVKLKAGIGSDAARDLNKRIKALGLKGIQSQYQGDAVRVTGKKRDELQAVIAALKEAELDLPLQFNNFRD